MADLAAGWVKGVAKFADITAVQIDTESQQAYDQMAWLLEVDALARVVDDIENCGIEGRAVLLIASSIAADADPKFTTAAIKGSN